MKKISKMSFVLVFTVLVLSAPCLRADDFFGAPPKGTPSIINYGWTGMTLGAMIGLSAGYIQYTNGSKAKTVALDTAYGALIGTGAGLLLGSADAARGKKGYGAIVLRDMHTGANLGAVVGGICGVVAAISNDNWENLGRGAAWGYIGGSAVGLCIAFYEGPKIAESSSSLNLGHGLTVMTDSGRNMVPGWQIASKF